MKKITRYCACLAILIALGIFAATLLPQVEDTGEDVSFGRALEWRV